MSIARTIALMRKEMRHIRRDPQSIFMTMLAPPVVLFLLAYTFSADLDLLRIGVIDHDRSAISREFLRGLTATGDIVIRAYPENYEAATRLLTAQTIKVAIIIPPGFGASVYRGAPQPLQAVLESSRYTYANQIYRSLSACAEEIGADLLRQTANEVASPLVVSAHALYNPTLKWLTSMVPGLMAAAFCFPAIAVALACAREVERGSYEGLLSTPMRIPEYLLGKLLPYLATGLVGAMLAWVLAVSWFRIPFRATLGAYALLATVFLLSLMSLSILIGSTSGNQRQAIIIIVLVFFIPTFFMSGLLRPLAPDSPLTRVLKLVLPAANYVGINRALFLKGLSLGALREETVNLLRISAVALGASVLFARRRVA